ncbi:MAG TPA: metal-sensing transcriptional repressor [Stenomitos sp.]
MEQQHCLETLRRIESKLQVIQAMVVAKRPHEELLSELTAAQKALSLVEAQVVADRSQA